MLVHVLFHLAKSVFTTKTIMTSIKMMIMLSTCQHQVFCIFFSGIAGLMPGLAVFRAGIAGPKSNKRVLL